jgi:hypothetical protein
LLVIALMIAVLVRALIHLKRRKATHTGYPCLTCFASILSHRIAAHLNAVCVVNQAVENAICYSRVPNLFVPTRNRQLRSQNQ